MLCFKNGKDNPGKFNVIADEDIFLCYSSNSKSYRVFNKRTLLIEEYAHIIFDELIMNPQKEGKSSLSKYVGTLTLGKGKCK